MARQSTKPFKINGKGYEHFYKTAAKVSYDQQPGESAGQYYRRLAKQANQRMTRLEDLAQSDDRFSSVLKYSYAKAQREARALKGSAAPKSKQSHRGYRFTETTLKNLNNQQIETRIKSVKEFLQSPTSNKADITTYYKQRAETMNKNWGTDFSWETLAKYYESGLSDKLKSKFESDGALQVIAALQKTPKEVIDKLESVDDLIKYVPDDIVRESVFEAITELDTEINEFFDYEDEEDE